MNKSGGGVAMYVDKNLNYKVVESMTTVIDNLLECITFEVCQRKKRMLSLVVYTELQALVWKYSRSG